jgi:hypothetical protein
MTNPKKNGTKQKDGPKIGSIGILGFFGSIGIYWDRGFSIRRCGER